MQRPSIADGSSTPANPRPCPICGKAATVADTPFCSKRCADVDLHRWLGGVYAVPASPDGAEDSDEDGSSSLRP